MNFESINNASKAQVFRKAVPAGESGFLDIKLRDHGYVDYVKIRFAAGENGTLRIRPVVIIPQEIIIDLFEYADGGDQYVSGDDETVTNSVKFEIESEAILRVYYENTALAGTVDSQLNVDIGVTYFRIVEPENIIGPRSRRW